MMGIFARLGTWKTRERKTSSAKPLRGPRPTVEFLEDRITPSTLLVGSGLLYQRVQDALAVAANGDTVQIEPGAQVTPVAVTGSQLASASAASATSLQVTNQNFTTPLAPGEVVRLDPGTASDELAVVTNIVNNNNTGTGTSTVTLAAPLKFAHSANAVIETTGNLAVSKNITIIGDQAYVPSQLPEFGSLWVTNTTSLKLQNLDLSNVTLLGSGTTIMNSMVQGNIVNQVATNAGAPVPIGGAPAAVSVAATGGGDTITNSTILGGIYLASTTNEMVSFNTFTGAGLVLSGAPNVASKVFLTGDTNSQVFDNMFEATGSAGIANNAIFVAGGTGNMIQANHIVLSASATTDTSIEVSNTNPFGTLANTQVDIRSNSISSNGLGTGLLFNGASGFTITSRVQGNDFRGSAIGVELSDGGTTTSLAGIDLGSSPTGSATQSLGGNDFRGTSFSGTTSTTHAAIVLLNVPAGFTLTARQNMFPPTVTNPHTLVVDSSNGGSGTIDVSQSLNANQELVQSTYAAVLGRVGTIADINGWVNVLGTSGPGAVANAIVHSAEASQIFLTQDFQQLLGRDPDSQGLAFFTNYLQSGGSREAVTAAILSSQEYRNVINRPQLNFNNLFIQSIYSNLLDRQPTNAELTFWTNQINSINYSGIASAIANSPEHQQVIVRNYYMTVLHRNAPPTQAEVSGWVNTGLDLLSIEAAMLSSQEFAQNG